MRTPCCTLPLIMVSYNHPSFGIAVCMVKSRRVVCFTYLSVKIRLLEKMFVSLCKAELRKAL